MKTLLPRLNFPEQVFIDITFRNTTPPLKLASLSCFIFYTFHDAPRDILSPSHSDLSLTHSLRTSTNLDLTQARFFSFGILYFYTCKLDPIEVYFSYHGVRPKGNMNRGVLHIVVKYNIKLFYYAR